MTVYLQRRNLDELLAGSRRIMADARAAAAEDGYEIAATVGLFSGGQDSTAVCYMLRDEITHFAHANTGIGIEATRQFVRDTVASWGKPLIEKHVRPGRTYRDMVLGEAYAYPRPGSPRYDPDLQEQEKQQVWTGFPGPPGHNVMYRNLKETAMNAVRADLLKGRRKARVIFVAGIRQAESQRRKARPEVSRDGKTVWASPILHWDKLDLNAYRRQHEDMPHNEITDLIHMSGECLCGAFAHPGELDELEFWADQVPSIRAVVDEIRDLEKQAQCRGIERCRWGFRAEGEDPTTAKSGKMCSTCDDRVDSEG